MQGYNIIMVYSPQRDMILLCKREKEPYLGLFNLVGGKIEQGEQGIDAAYRELWEETGISQCDITLTHMMDFTYYLQGCYVEVYVGRLQHPITVQGDENELFWSDLDQNFFDPAQYAGEGNIGHMVEQVKLYENELLS